MQIVAAIFLLLISTIVLIKSADLTLSALKSLTRELHAKVFAISAIILAIATSLPELFVGITSALEGTSHLSLGNIMGANIANLSLVAGVSAIFTGRVLVHDKVVFKEIFLAGGAAMLPIILLIDGSLSRIDGIILLVVYLVYATSFFKLRFMEVGKHHMSSKSFFRFIKHVEEVEQKSEKTLAHLIVGVIFLLLSANFIVKFASNLAEISGVPLFIIGAVILSIGTTLPEMVVSLESLKKGSSSVFFGSILGSLIVNSTLILGLVAVISPVQDSNIGKYTITLMAFAIIFFLFWLFTRTKGKLDRWEAVILLLVYISFAIIEFL